MADADQVKDAAEAYLYGYPLVYDLQEVAEFVEGGGSLPIQAPYNTFASARRLLGPESMFVSPNNDTLYLVAMLDVREGPVVLHVPDTEDRYYVLQFVDAWTNNFAYIGRRATGTAEADSCSSAAATGRGPRGHDRGAGPDRGLHHRRATPGRRRGRPAGRPRLAGPVHPDDFPAVPAACPARSPGSRARSAGLRRPAVVGAVPRRSRRLPATGRRAPFVALAERLGLAACQSPYVDPDPALAEVLAAGQQAGQARIEELGKAGGGGAWRLDQRHAPVRLQPRPPRRRHRSMRPNGRSATARRPYVTRAVAARGGLWGNHGYEADYAFVWPTPTAAAGRRQPLRDPSTRRPRSTPSGR